MITFPCIGIRAHSSPWYQAKHVNHEDTKSTKGRGEKKSFLLFPSSCSSRLRGSNPLRFQEWVAIVRRGDEGLLDGAGAGPADEVPQGARLVVRAGGARPAE